MVPRDLFNKMSALALLSILLFGAMSIRAFAAEVPPSESQAQEAVTEGSQEDSPDPPAENPPEENQQESESSSGEPLEPSPEDPPGDNAQDPTEEGPPEGVQDPAEEDLPGSVQGPAEEEPPEDDPPASALAEDVASIRQCMELLVYGVLPLSTAFFLVYKFCMWFYCTFIQSVL